MVRLHSLMTPPPPISGLQAQQLAVHALSAGVLSAGVCIVLISLLLSLVLSGLTPVRSCQPSDNRRPPCMYVLSISLCG